MIFKFLWLSFCICSLKTIEILIRDVSSICYLNKSFNTRISYFPEDFEFSVHLTRVPGLLFYSVDVHLNQLIVKIHDEFDPFLTIEFNKKKYLIAIKKLCDCQTCLFETLNFRFQLKEGIIIQCNNGEVVFNKYFPNKNFESKYPIPNFNENNVTAYLWMVNTPEFNTFGSKFYPDNEFITGCISRIMHNNVPLQMDYFGQGIYEQCNKQCSPRICNDGICLETFELKPICDCYRTYKNGDFCNASHVYTDLENDGFQFEVLKISWASSLEDILSLKNKNIQLTIEIRKRRLRIQLRGSVSQVGKLDEIILEQYFFNYESVLILNLEYQMINIEVRSHLNNSWINVKIPVNLTLNKEVFDQVKFLNNSRHEMGEIVFKVSKKETKWRYIGNHIRKRKKLENFSNRQTFTKESKEIVVAESRILHIIIGLALGAVFAIVIVIVVIFKHPRCSSYIERKRRQKSRTGTILRYNDLDYQFLNANPNRLSRIDL